jgi:hypothetical protein
MAGGVPGSADAVVDRGASRQGRRGTNRRGAAGIGPLG